MTANFAIDRLNPEKVQQNPAMWERVVRKLRTGTMPPPGSPRPAPEVYNATAAWLESELDRTALPNPGRPALRRLNRAEYGNAIRDLLDLPVDVESLLLPDDAAFGFDNIRISRRFTFPARTLPHGCGSRQRAGRRRRLDACGSANLQRAR